MCVISLHCRAELCMCKLKAKIVNSDTWGIKKGKPKQK